MSPTRWDVLGIGCNSVDYVYRLPAAPMADSPTAKLRISSHQTLCGGQMATAMAACAALGLRAGYLGCVGHDHNGRLVVSELQQRGVDVSALMTRACANRFAVIAVDETSGERIVLWDRDDRLNLSQHDIDPGAVSAARIVHVDDEDQDGAIAAATMAKKAGVPVTSDIERMTARTPELIAAVSVPIFAQHLLPQLTGEDDPERALRSIRRSHDGTLFVTLGERGAMMLVGETLFVEPARAVNVVDTTGAGDVFRAACIYALLNNYEPRALLRFATAAAAASCTRVGAISGVPTLEETRHLLSG
jgi:sulfofructose kinase